MKQLDKAFNITPVEVSTTPENGCSPKKEQLTNITKPEKPDRLTKDDISKDYDYTRGNLYSIIEQGQEAIDGILELAQESEQPFSGVVSTSTGVILNALSNCFIRR